MAAIGLYGVIAYTAAQRTREIGVRIALGAEPRHVVAMIASQAGRLVAFGIRRRRRSASALMLRLLEAMLFGASAIDLPIFRRRRRCCWRVVAMAAIWVPAPARSRASSPLDALRAE